MSMRVSYVTIFLALAVAPLGCATTSNRPRLDPREVLGRPVSDAVEVPVEFEGDRVAVAQLACGGAFATRLGPAQNVVHFRLRIRNGDAATLAVPVDSLTLEGAAAAALHAPLVLVGQERQSSAVEIAPGTSREVDIVFSLPGGVDVEEVDGFTLVWGTRVDGHLVSHETSFAVDDRVTGQIARAFRPTI